MRFLADMCISRRTVIWLRQQGHDAVHLSEERLQRAPDEAVLAKARQENRVLLTMDLDFGYLLAVSRAVLPSVILFRVSDERAEIINERLADILAECADDLESGVVVSVGERAFRVRSLPI